MNPIAEEILSYYGVSSDEQLEHYGMPRRSGRYPWGSGEDPYQSGGDFLGRVETMRKEGFEWTDPKTGKHYTGDTAIAKSLGLSTGDFRTEIAICKDERRMANVATAERLRDKEGMNTSQIGRAMGVNESTVRNWFDEKAASRMKVAKNTADFLKKQVDEKEMIDVGTGVERELGISKEKLGQALYMLQREGYEVYKGGIPQATNPGQQTNQVVLCKPGTKHSEIYDYGRVKTINDYITRDGGDTYEKKFHYPESMDSKRLAIRYKEDGGIEKDGIVEIRPGVKDLSLGESRYSQVRILVDGDHYIKGMAVYGDPKDFPKGVDVIFNTNKDKSKSKMEVLKEVKRDKDGNIDQDNPFGSAIKDSSQGGQYWYTDKKTGEKKLGLINKRADQGDWSDWSNGLPSQFLGKQSKTLAKKQLDLAKAEKYSEYDEIASLTNPTIKKHLLSKFADDCDSAAVHLKAAALPGQKYHVIIPVPSLKDTEVYAPNYENGTKLALIRYPHGGTFEIPILTVNNKQVDAKKLLGAVQDAVAINSRVAERLSGADFDGDTVMCIPTHDSKGRVKITNREPLTELVGFDPKMEYPERAGMKYMKDPKTGKDATQAEMGKISNLITDMTLAGADDKELARAVKHSMVVIDAAKHKLDYKRSEQENNIDELKRKYQPKLDKNGKPTYGGAGTLLSRAKGEVTVDKRQGEARVNIKGKDWYDPSKPEGSLIYKPADDLYYPDRTRNKKTGMIEIKTTDGRKIAYDPSDGDARDRYTPVKRVDPKTGEVNYTDRSGTITYKLKKRTQASTRMAEADDAYSLVSEARHPMELIYADYANSMKALANQARKEMLSTGKIEYSSTAKATYQKEVDSLMFKLNDALLNTTRERAAQRMANADIAAKKASNPNMKNADIKKASQQAISRYREEVGSVTRRDRNIDITDREWEAIQAGAISETKLKQILNNTDIDKLRERATPRATTTLSTAKINTIKAMQASNYSLEQIAKKLGVSTSTVSKYLKGGK